MTQHISVRGGMRLLSFLILAALLLLSCYHGRPKQPEARQSAIRVRGTGEGPRAELQIISPTAQFVLMANGSFTASLLENGTGRTLEQSAISDAVVVSGTEISDFIFAPAAFRNPVVTAATGKLGIGTRIELTGKSASTGLEKRLALEVYDDFPNVAITSVAYRNGGGSEITLDKVITQRHKFDASRADAQAKPYHMWSFQGASIDWGKDEILLLPASFRQENIMGEPVNEGHGGGVPVVAFWTRSLGEAIGHLETLPLVVSMPVTVGKDQRVEAAVVMRDAGVLKPGETFSTPRTFVAVYAGDFYEPLHMYSQALQKQGWTLPKPTSQDYQAAWCGWGYGFNVTPKQMTDTIPKLKELGIQWATLDDRWFDTYGDWNPRADTFPGNAINTMVDEFHKQGLKAQIWWLPLAVEDRQGKYESHKYVASQVVKDHPDWLVLDRDGKHARTIRNLAILCPALPEVQQYYKQLTEKFIRDWGFDGHKLDNIYTVPACYNPKHHHKSPHDSIDAMGEVYRQVFQTTRALKPESVTQSCPCGTTPSIAWLPYLDQAVTADPVGGAQVRRRIKMYKALLGPEAAVYGDHVELSEMKPVGKDNLVEYGRDFASTIGPGGVVGTKFTWPSYGAKFKDVELSPAKEAHWAKWIALYNQKMLSRGEFRNFYVLGYDNPEGYVIAKDGAMYYACFTTSPASSYAGEIELRGLNTGRYRVLDYAENRDLGTVEGASPKVKVRFTGHLLLQVSKE